MLRKAITVISCFTFVPSFMTMATLDFAVLMKATLRMHPCITCYYFHGVSLDSTKVCKSETTRGLSPSCNTPPFASTHVPMSFPLFYVVSDCFSDIWWTCLLSGDTLFRQLIVRRHLFRQLIFHQLLFRPLHLIVHSIHQLLFRPLHLIVH